MVAKWMRLVMNNLYFKQIVSDIFSVLYYLSFGGTIMTLILMGSISGFLIFPYTVFIEWPTTYPTGTYTFLLVILLYLMSLKDMEV